MSDYCRGCRFDPGRAAGEGACPFTTLYWDFLRRHRALLQRNPRMRMQVRNLDRLDGSALREVRRRAEELRGAADRDRADIEPRASRPKEPS